VFPLALEITDGARRDSTAPPVLTTHRSWPTLSREVGAIVEARPLAAPLPGLAEYAAGVGHTLALPDPDGVVRRAPLLVRVGDRGVPALGVALAATFRKTGLDRIPLDRRGRAVIGFATAGLKVVPLSEVWAAIEERRAEALQTALQTMVEDRIVLLLVEPAARLEPHRLSRGRDCRDPAGAGQPGILGGEPRGGSRRGARRGRALDRGRGSVAGAARDRPRAGRADACPTRAAGARVADSRRWPSRTARRRRARAATKRVRADGDRHPRPGRAGGVPGPREGGEIDAADPDRGRARDRQGAVRASRPSPEPTSRWALRRREHGRDLSGALRERAVRPRQGKLHRRDCRPQGAPRAGGPGNELPRRSRRAAAG